MLIRPDDQAQAMRIGGFRGSKAFGRPGPALERAFVGPQVAEWIGGRLPLFFAGALRLDKLGRVGGIKCVEFFFAGRNRR